MGLSHRIAFRIYAGACRARRRLALRQLTPAAAAFLPPVRHQQPPTHRLYLLGVTLLLLLLPFTSRQEAVQQACGVGAAALLTACVVWFYNLQATMDDHHPGGWRWQREETRDGGGRGEEGWRQLGKQVLQRVTQRYLAFETALLKMKNLSILVNQLVFFSVCERLLMHQQKLTSLYTLMFFNVVAYCVSYIKDTVAGITYHRGR